MAEDVHYFALGNETLAAEIRARLDRTDYCIAALEGLDELALEESNLYVMCSLLFLTNRLHSYPRHSSSHS